MKNTPEEVARNEEILAERLCWPEGALEACRDLQKRYPGWSVALVNENTFKGFERPAGFSGVLSGSHDAHRFAETADELETLMRSVPEHDYSVNGCRYCIDQADERIRRARLPGLDR